MDDFYAFLAGKSGIVLGALVLFFVLERLFPVARWVGGAARVIKNFALACVNLFAGPLVVIPVTALAASHAIDWRPDWLSGSTGLVFDILLLDLWIYWWHRLNHVVPCLWRFHEVHHLDETLDTSSALRFHFGEVILSALVRSVVILAFAVPLSSVIVFEALVIVAALFQHSNLRLPSMLERGLSWFIVTPSIHWLHHHAKRSDTDSSYALFLSVWDRVFGTRSLTRRTPDLPIGVEGRSDRPFLGLLFRPIDPP